VQIENIHFRSIKENPSPETQPLVRVTSSSLILRNCGFQLAEASSGHISSGSQTGVEWQHIDPANPASGRVGFENCVFVGAGNGCRLQSWPSQLAVKNCLKTDAGVLLDFGAEGPPPPHLQLNLSQLTLRGAGGLLRCDLGPKAGSTSWLIQAEDCVFDLHAGPSAVFQSAGDSPGRFFQRMQLQGRHCLLNESAAVAGWWNPSSKELQPLDSSSLSIEGLVLARLIFAGPQNHRPADSELTTWQGPRFSSKVPGIIPADLPNLPD
jgi:hypothetical protein